MTLGERLRESRKKMGWSQTYVSHLTSIPNSSLSNYERDFRRPDMQTLSKLAALYHQSLDYLIAGGSDDRRQSSFLDSHSSSVFGNFRGEYGSTELTLPLVMIPVLREPPQLEPTDESPNEFMPVLASEVDALKFEYFGLRVKDDSMRQEGIVKGDLILVRRHLSNLGRYVNGTLRVVQLEEKYTIRRVYETDVVIALQAASPHQSLKLLPKQIELDEYGEPIPDNFAGGYGLGEVIRVVHNCPTT